MGPDKIENILLKIVANTIAPFLVELFTQFINECFIPEQWKQMEIILLHEKGPRKDLNNYRFISLSSNISNVFGKVVKNRIHPVLDAQQPRE